MAGSYGRSRGGSLPDLGSPGRVEGKIAIRPPPRDVESVYLRTMPGGVRHSRAADRRYPGPYSRHPDCPGKQRIYLPDGRGRTRTPLSSRPDRPALAAQGEEVRAWVGARFLGRCPEADLPGAPGAGEGKTTRPVRVPDGRQKYAADGVCGGIRRPFGVLPLFPLARPRRQRAGFTAGGRGGPSLSLRPATDGFPSHARP